jgi:hypothetical protein
VNTWYEYRGVWSTYPWVLGVAIIAVLLLAIGVVGTIAGDPAALFFIPGLGAVFVHHLIVTKKAG